MNNNFLNNNIIDDIENINNVDLIVDNDIETLNFDNDEIENLEPNFTKIISEKIIDNDLNLDNFNDLKEDIEEIIDLEDDLDESNNLKIQDSDIENKEVIDNKIDINKNSEIKVEVEEKENNKEEIKIEPFINNVIEQQNSQNIDEVSNNETINNENNIHNLNNIEQENNVNNNDNNSNIENKIQNDANIEIKNDSSSEFQNETENKIKNDNQNDNHDDIKKENDTLLSKYGENFSVKKYVCNPAIGRDNEIKQLILTLLTPEKSGILVGKPGIGKTAIVEGLGYQIQKGNVPDALKGYQIHKLNTSSLLGVMPGTNEPKIQVLLNEIKGKEKLILFIDEIHTLSGAGAEGDDSLDFANIFKPGLDRGNIKIIGATTTDEYDRYILTDKAFVRRFQKIDVLEPTKEHTVKILMGSLPKLEYKTGAKLKYSEFIQEKIMTFIVDLTTEYRRVYELSARYPDIALTILQQAFSYAVFDNKKEVSIRDVRKAVNNTKLVYPDVIKKELIRFNELFSDIYLMETKQRLKGE